LDRVEYDISAADHNKVRKTKHPPALRAQPFVTPHVVIALLDLIMRRTIQLDDKARVDAQESAI
jgi:hypothetical protein